MARMLSALKKPGKEEDFAKYKALRHNKQRHEFYYNCWLAENPKHKGHTATRSRTSERVDTDRSKDHGYQSRDYVAAMMKLEQWRTIPEQRVLLELELAKLPSKPHEQAAHFPDGMDQNVYHFVESLVLVDEHNKKSFTYDETNDLDEAQGEALLAGIDGSSSSTSTALTNSRRNRPSRSPTETAKPPKPQWLVDFEKSALNFFKTNKRAVELASKQATDLVKQAEDHKSSLDQLCAAYLDTVQRSLKALDKADEAGTQFQLATEAKPADETAAKTLTAEWKEAANELKAAKTAFLTATQSMQTSLRAALAPILKASA